MQSVVKADGLTKTFTIVKKDPGIAGALKALFKPNRVTVEAVKGVSFEIGHGELVGFLGPNGAGKTTTLKMLTGILHPTSGSARVLDSDPTLRKPQMLKQISLVMGNKNQLWWDLPAWESFIVLKEIYEVPDDQFKTRIEELMTTLEIKDKVHTQVRRLSLGERMKCELAASLIHNPRVLFLDEPTLGLDIISQKKIREFLRQQNRENKTTILLTSHYMQDVAELCERVIVIDHGSLLFDGSLADLSVQYKPLRKLRILFRSESEVDLSVYGTVVSSSPLEAVIEVPRDRTTQIAARVLQELPVEDLSIEEVDIEEVMRDMFTRSPATTPTG
ncbi:MAG: ATP-binding cassette domain-containing protein [Armatimonadetes bacterium]|nr:MAG: ATP-binding cassette domain-containing protein [Armatimonadota bacterium]MCE7900538.1 ATP-binding cassette domain-containing protein [Armatimonadetes bacterium ATM1]MDL1929608.1 ATP-binding cassette domain-containing protein [Fimbriimonadia bacterium ATM]MBC6970135.1 ATP-binding cassette domain-containing protein [Armatimonadota bacterium]MBL1149885.1 ATP-binding cassette domain-containing protein [Armatimonadota bacterium]